MFGYRAQVVKRNELHTFQVLPKRWIVERTFSWLNWSRRLSKNYELRHSSAESMTYIAFTHQSLRRYA
jgi:transposase